MIGEDVGALIREIGAGSQGRPRLVIDDLSMPAESAFGVDLKHISLTVRGGEIISIAGVAGNGQSELFDALSGETLCDNPSAIRFDEQDVGHLTINQRRKVGGAFVPEERLGHGAVPVFKLSENALLSRHAVGDGLSAGFLLRRGKMHTLSDDVISNYDVRKGVGDAEARSLSGGNLQKFVVGRELNRNPVIVVVNQPTWGVDAGAANLIRQSLINLAKSGAAIVTISQDLDEIFEISDKIAVISRGELSQAYPADEISLEEIGMLMAGKAERKPAAGAEHAG